MKIFSIDNKPKYLLLASFIIGMIMMAGVYEFGIWFSNNYRLQPVIVPRDISPVNEEYQWESIPSTTPAPKVSPRTNLKGKTAIVTSSKYPDFIDHIWLRESGRGTATAGLNVSCAKKGLSNEMGFYPSGKHCFADFETSVKRLERWYEDNSALTDNQKLCRYNSGTASNSCAYLTLSFKDMN